MFAVGIAESHHGGCGDKSIFVLLAGMVEESDGVIGHFEADGVYPWRRLRLDGN